MGAPHAASLRPGRQPVKSWQRTPEEEATYQAMLAKCRKWAEPKSEPLPELDAKPLAETPNEQPRLLWIRKSAYLMTSGCQRYQIQKEVLGNHVTHDGGNTSTGRWMYQPWKRVQWLWYVRLGPALETFDAAKEACEIDVRDPEQDCDCEGLPEGCNRTKCPRRKR